MPGWLKQWLPSLILPLLAFAWYLADDRAALRERVALLEYGQQREDAVQTLQRLTALEVQLKALQLSVQGVSQTVLLLASERFQSPQ